jgi:hypothetical protein
VEYSKVEINLSHIYGDPMALRNSNIALISYVILAVILSFSLLYFACSQDVLRFGLYLILYAVVALLTHFLRSRSLPLVGAIAFLSGFLETSWQGYNIDPGAGMVVLAAAIYALQRYNEKKDTLAISEFLLLALAAIAIVSVCFTLVKITSFFPVDGYGYSNYPVNGFGIASDDLILQVLRTGSVLFSLFGLFLAGRAYPFAEGKGLLFYTIVCLAIVTLAVLLYQENIDPAFMFPKGAPKDGRLNGPTSFCYALGAGAESILLLLPFWFYSRHKTKLFLGAATILVMFYAINKSGSRAALIICICYLVIWGIAIVAEFLTRLKPGLKKFSIGLLAIVFLLAAIWIYQIIPAETTSSLGRFKHYNMEEGGLWEHLSKTRFVHYSVAVPMFVQSPINGIGVGTYYVEAQKFADLNVPGYQPWDEYGVSSNLSNFYLGLSVELGVFAGALFFLWILSLFISVKTSTIKEIPRYVFLAGISLYAAGLVLGPQLLNAESTAWIMLFAGGIASGKTTGKEEKPKAYAWFMLIAVLLMVVIFSVLSRPDITMFEQWKKLQWHQDNGWFPEEDKGRWSSLNSSMSIPAGKILNLKFHSSITGENNGQKVEFYLNSSLIHSGSYHAGKQGNLKYKLPAQFQDGALLSIIVDKPFIPSQHLDTSDQRELGIFVSSVRVRKYTQEKWGFFDKEIERDGEKFFWSGKESSLVYRPALHHKLYLRSLSDDYPVVLTILAGEVIIKTVVLQAKWQQVDIKTSLNEAADRIPNKKDVVLKFEADRSISPSELGLGNDKRNLSFAVKWKEAHARK